MPQFAIFCKLMMRMKMNDLVSQDGPELVFGLVGPIGADMECVVDELTSSLKMVGYEAHLVHITAVLPEIFHGRLSVKPTLSEKIELANELRRETKNEAMLAAVSMLKIRSIREEINTIRKVQVPNSETSLSDIPCTKTAYIIRQLKRDEEVKLLRDVYGNGFIQISVAIDEAKQLEDVVRIVARQEPKLSHSARVDRASKLINADREELSNQYGLRMSDAFQSADFFVAGNTRQEIISSIDRIVRALFGYNHIGPTKDEFGAMMAKTASLRSVDLSRQVGAAITTTQGDLIALGCNEVPAAGGGQYWCDDALPARDIDIGIDPNKMETHGVVDGFIAKLSEHGMLKDSYEDVLSSSNYASVLKESAISDLTEFGRITHAEMSAITEAARLGRSVAGATMYVTTFPCHNCAKHIVASGIMRIVYVEPYTKSRALSLHQDALTTDSTVDGKVKLEHFKGIAPRRFRKIFEKGRRKNKTTHVAESWYEGLPVPLLWERSSLHTRKELKVIKASFEGLVQPAGSSVSGA